MHRLDGKVAIVTGSAAGIGRAIAEAMSREGAGLAIADSDFPRAQAVSQSIIGAGGTAVPVRVDVASRPDVEALVDTTEVQLGLPDILVCSAGIIQTTQAAGILELDDEEWDSVLGVNLRGTFLCAQAVARRLVARSRPGSLITVSSIGAERPVVGTPAYHTSKAAVEGLTRALAVNLAPYGIRANCIAPGHTLTDLTRGLLQEPEKHDYLLARIPLRRMAEPSDLAGAAVYLASDEASYVTGEVFHIDGGARVLGGVRAGSLEPPPSLPGRSGDG